MGFETAFHAIAMGLAASPARSAWVVHLLGVLLWVGGLIAVSIQTAQVAERTRGSSDRTVVLAAARSLHHWMVAPGFVLLLIGGLWSLVALEPQKLREGWFHAKLGLALVLVAVNFLVVMKLYDLLRTPDAPSSRWSTVLPAVTAVAVVATLLLIRYKPF